MKIKSLHEFSEAIQNDNDFIGMWADKLGISREEYVAHYASPTIGSGIDEAVEEGINDFSPLSYAKKVANKIMTLADAAKEANMAQTELLKLVRRFDKNFKMTYEASDHEVGMAQGQLEAIINAAMDLQEKIGAEEKDLPGWIQSHITSSYEYLKQANDNFHELEESEETNEALKMLMDPLMVKIMKQFGFKADPGIRAELKNEIQAAVEEVLRKHDVIVEGTFNDGEIAIYTDTRGDAGETQIWKRGKGYYGQNDSFDFEAKDKKELEMKLKRWGYELIAGSID
jgi:hypothetical protein